MESWNTCIQNRLLLPVFGAFFLGGSSGESNESEREREPYSIMGLGFDELQTGFQHVEIEGIFSKCVNYCHPMVPLQRFQQSLCKHYSIFHIECLDA